MATILIVYKEFPARSVGHAGGQAIFRLMEALHRQGHRLLLVARLRRGEERLLAETAPLCARLETVPHARALSGPLPLAYLRSYLLLRQATARVLRQERPDYTLVEFAQTAVALLGLRLPYPTLRPHDVNWFLLEQRLSRLRGPRRWGLAALARLMRGFEPWLCRRYALVAAISEGDRRLLAPRCGSRPVLLLPMAPAFSADVPVEPAVPGGPNVLFGAAMYRGVNQEGARWFLDEVWPRVIARAPQARFYIVGSDPPPDILARQDGERVFVTGYQADLVPWYRAATVFVSPLLVAVGLLQKVLDALAMGVPVVATTVSNHGVGATPGEHLLLADEPAAFADAVVRLLEEPALRERIGQAARQFVHERYDLEAAVAQWSSRCDRAALHG